ncbi:hypothetical protein BDQ17DRAFT_1364317, partial [Cyathus striatus]
MRDSVRLSTLRPLLLLQLGPPSFPISSVAYIIIPFLRTSFRSFLCLPSSVQHYHPLPSLTYLTSTLSFYRLFRFITFVPLPLPTYTPLPIPAHLSLHLSSPSPLPLTHLTSYLIFHPPGIYHTANPLPPEPHYVAQIPSIMNFIFSFFHLGVEPQFHARSDRARSSSEPWCSWAFCDA